MEGFLSNLYQVDREIKLLEQTGELLAWDQEIYMPAKGITGRADQLALLEALKHRKITQPRVGMWLKLLKQKNDPELDPNQKAFIREFERLYRKAVLLDQELVKALARQASLSQAKWVEAKKASDYSLFLPDFKKLLSLLREKAACYPEQDCLYDALLDDYEPGYKKIWLEQIFKRLEPPLIELYQKIKEAPAGISDKILKRDFDSEKQKRFCRYILKSLGFDFTRARLDQSEHPFTISPGHNDVRITTRYNPQYLNTSVFGTIHECGHAFYDLGVDPAFWNTILAGGVSMGIHESQSRFWENIIGRSLAFWKFMLPAAKDIFKPVLDDVTPEMFFQAVNYVNFSPVRVEADEVGYNLHIILRFRLEQGLLSGDLPPEDLPGAWNSESERLLGVKPQNEAEGVLQDIHWSMGAVGYFPAYTLGNLYAAQFYRVLKRAQPDLEHLIEKGDFAPILVWLGQNIHKYGRLFPAKELCAQITGEDLSARPFIDYLSEKYTEIYNL